MSGKINGQDWSSILTLSLTVGAAVSVAGNDGCTPARVLGFVVNVTGAGTYTIPPPLEPDPFGLTANYYTGNHNPGDPFWYAQQAHGTGSVTFNSLSATAATGTYSFTLLPQEGTSATGSVVVSGSFNVHFKSSGSTGV